jgi:hypothetical protein
MARRTVSRFRWNRLASSVVLHPSSNRNACCHPSEHSARTLFASIKDQCTAVMNHTEAQAYQRGVQDSTQAKSAEDAGFEI